MKGRVIAIGAGLAGLAVVGLLGAALLWSGSAPVTGVQGAVNGQPDARSSSRGADPSPRSAADRWRELLRTRTTAAEWLQEQGRGVEIACADLPESVAASASQVLPARRVGDVHHLFRFEPHGGAVVGEGTELGALRWSAEGCSFEPIEASLVTGSVSFEDGAPAPGTRLMICNTPVEVDSHGTFEVTISPAERAWVADDHVRCLVSAHHPQGWKNIEDTHRLDEPLSVVLDQPFDPGQIGEVAARLADTPGVSAGASADALWLEQIVSESAPPPRVRAYLEGRAKALREAGGSSGAASILDELDELEADLEALSTPQ